MEIGKGVCDLAKVVPEGIASDHSVCSMRLRVYSAIATRDRKEGRRG